MNLRAHLVRGIFGSLGLTITTAAVSFVNGVLLARLLGANGYGIYASAIAVVLLLSAPLALGLDRLLTRDVAASGAQGSWGEAKGLIRRAVQVVVPVSLIAIVIVGVGAAALSGSLDGDTLPVLWLALLMVPLLVLIALRRAITLGLQRIISSQLPDSLVRPGVFGVLLLIAYVASGTLTALAAMALNLVSVIVALVFGLALLVRQVPDQMRASASRFRSRHWLREAVPFALAATATTLMNQIDVVLVGALAGATAAGLYSVAARGAALALFGALAVNTTLAPAAAHLWTRNERARLQFVVTRGARGALLFALVVAALLCVFGDQFLLLFGPEFSAAYATLVVLAITQVIDCGFGIGGLMLSMTGFQGLNFAAIAFAVVLRIAIGIALIPTLGSLGAAVAAAVAITIMNVIATYFCGRRLGLDATPIGAWHPRVTNPPVTG